MLIIFSHRFPAYRDVSVTKVTPVQKKNGIKNVRTSFTYRFNTNKVAVCFADQRVLERMKEFKIVKNQAANKIIKFIISTGVIVLMLKVWDSQWGLEHFEFALTGLIPVLIIDRKSVV